jgi:hypothetical protein
MVQRDDGFFDIYDLKTAAPNRKSITKGKRNRRRFIDYVEEGIAQLAHYEEYFRYDENCKFAFENYGIKVSNPNLYLVAGNLENANEQQLDEACRKLKNIKVIDYDTLSGMFYKSVFRS